MSLRPDVMMNLMAYADGELDAAERAKVEELLRSNEEARRVVSAMGALGDVVREGAAEREPVSLRAADGIADGVMAALAKEDSTRKANDGGKVVSLAAARASRMPYVAAALVAAAAGAVLFFRTPSGPVVTVEDKSPIAMGSAPASAAAPSAPASAVATAESDEGVDLEEAESTQDKVDVFFTSSPAKAGAVASVVVWIDDRHGGH
jgi:hypothetical protein